MALFALAVVGLVAAGAFAVQLGLRKKKGAWLIDSLSVSVMVGFLGVALLAFAFKPSPTAEVGFLPVFTPHAYALVIYSVGYFAILRPRFGRLGFPAFCFAYALTEVFFNGLAATYEATIGDLGALLFLSNLGWQLFFGVCVSVVVVVWFTIKPRFKPNPTWLVFLAVSLAWAWGAGLPTMNAIGIGSAPLFVMFYSLAWELTWQATFWLFIWRSLWPKVPQETAETLVGQGINTRRNIA
jgi:hypothetical protein